MNPTSEDVPCDYVNKQQSCPGLEGTLRHSSENGLSGRALAFHVAKCSSCLASTLRCMRAGCPVAGRPFVGVADLGGLNGRWDGLLRTWCNDVFRDLPWTGMLQQVDAENFREDAILHAWKLLLSDVRFDPERLLMDGRPAGPLIKKAMRNRMKTLRRGRDMSARDPVTGKHYLRARIGSSDQGLDDTERSTGGAQRLFPAISSAEDHALANLELEAVADVLRQVYEGLANAPDQQFVVGEFLQRRLRGGELPQAELAKLLQRDRELRKDGSHHKATPSQATISRWINRSRLAIAAMLGDAARGISPSCRTAVLQLFASAKHADITTYPEAEK